MARSIPTLTPAQLKAFLAAHPGWSRARGQLQRTVELDTFPHAIGFVREVARLAEEAHHHPDIDIRYRQVTLRLVTHDAGGLTALDTALADRLEQAALGARR